MKKRYFWAAHRYKGEAWIHRFRIRTMANEFVSVIPESREMLIAAHPEVRRINRMIAAGELVVFPVKV